MNGAVLGDSLAWEGELPLAWGPLEALPEGNALAALNGGDEELLRVLAILEERRSEGEEEDPVAARLGRMELRLNLLLTLVGELAAAQGRLPGPLPVRFSDRGVEWRPGGEPPAPGAWIEVSLYLHAALPRPLRLPARVESLAEGWVAARFEGLTEGVADQLHKFIFRHHRRVVAAAKSRRD